MVSLLPYWWYSGYRVCDGRWSVVQEKSEGMIPTDAEKNWKREIRGIILPLTCIVVMWLTVISLDKQTKLNVFKCAPKIKIKQQARVNTDKGKPNPTELLFFLFFLFFPSDNRKVQVRTQEWNANPQPLTSLDSISDFKWSRHQYTSLHSVKNHISTNWGLDSWNVAINK